MKFARTDLIAKVEAEITRREQHAVRKTAEDVERYRSSLAAYLERTTPLWTQFADTIRARKRYGKPVTAEDVPQGLQARWNNGIDFWSTTAPTPREVDVEPLKVLLGFLQAATDDEISTASMERLGFPLSTLFRARS